MKVHIKRSLIFFCIAFTVLISPDVSAQPFQKAIGVNGLEQAEVIKMLPDGGFIIGGQTDSYGNEDRNMLFLRTDASGNVLWNRTYGGIEREVVSDIIPTSDGGFLMASEKYRLNNMNGEFLMMLKTDANGSLTWKKLFDEGGNETEGYSIQHSTDGGYVITGIFRQANAASDAFFTMRPSEQSLYLLKINQAGTKIWSRIYNPGNSTYKSSTGIAACPANGGGFLITGNLALNGSNNSNEERAADDMAQSESRNLLLMKTDNDGKLLWSREYEGNRVNMGYSVLPKQQGGYMVGGVTNIKADNIDIFLMSVKDNGDVEWAKTYGGLQYDAISDLQTTQDGGYIISGLTRSCGAGANDALLFKTDKSGNLLWAKAYGGTDGEVANSVVVTPDGFVFTGDISSKGSEGTDIYFVKTDLQGNSGCHQANCSFSSSNFLINSKYIEGAVMKNVSEIITKAAPIKSIDISNVVESENATRTKNICNF